MPQISVIVPVYKAESYLQSCVDSILAQTFSDFEVILVDDGSPDGCGAICDAYAAREPRVQVIHQENQGQAAARNHALPLSKGAWLCFVDSDDLIHPRMLELLYLAVQESGAAVSMCQMLEAPQLPGDFFAPQEPDHQVFSMDDTALAQLYDREEYPGWVACAKLIRRDLVEGYPFTQGRVFEDNEAVCRWLCRGGTLAWMAHKLYFYRTNIGSTTKSRFSLKKLDYLWALESITRFYGQLGYPQMKARFASRYLEAAASACYGLRSELNLPQEASRTGKWAWRFAREEKLRPTRAQMDALVDAAFPGLVRFYWPLVGACRTCKDQGISTLAAKIMKRGDRP